MLSRRSSHTVLLALPVLLALLCALQQHADATGFPTGGGCCCCGGAPAAPPPPPPPPPPSSCCCCGGGRKKRQLFTGLAEFERYVQNTEKQLYCCGMSGRKRRHTGQPVSKRIEFGVGSQLSNLMFH